jgi:hypothetical protein
MQFAGTWIFLHQLCSAGTSGWICCASRAIEYHIRKRTAALMTSSTHEPSVRVALYCTPSRTYCTGIQNIFGIQPCVFGWKFALLA